MTVQDIIDRAEEVFYKDGSYREGCVVLKPNVELIHKPSGKVVHVQSVDQSGRYLNCVHTEELGFWYPVDQFEFPAPAKQ